VSARWAALIGAIVAAIVVYLVMRRDGAVATRADGGAETAAEREEAAKRARVVGSGEALSPRPVALSPRVTDGGVVAQPGPAALAGLRGAPAGSSAGGGAGGGSGGGSGVPPPSSGVSKEAVQAAVRAALPKLIDCYNKHLVGTPDAGPARVAASFEIVAKNGKGHIESAEISDGSLGSPVADLCLMNALGEVDFPIPQGATEVRYKVTYPFQFAP
jgi:hypothetical protein